MTKAEQKRVVQFLYSIQTTEWAAENIKKDIEILDEKIKTPPKITSGEGGVSGGESVSKQERWVLFEDQYLERRSFLVDMLAEHQRKINDYYSTLQKMVELEDWGSLANEICREKYYRHRTPDVAIYNQLFCPSATYYRILYRLQQFFIEVLPNRFAD